MAESAGLAHADLTFDGFIRDFRKNLDSIDSGLSREINFQLEIQRNNLLSLLSEANRRITRYEHIYPYIKELCHNQSINPVYYKNIEGVLNWALKKGRGKGRELQKEIKDAWITYIVVLSYFMIDKEKQVGDFTKNIFLKTDQGKIVGLRGSN